MKLSIRAHGVRRSTGHAPAPLRVFGGVLAWLTGVRRLSLRVAPPDAPPRVELLVERRAAVTAYRLRGRALGLARTAAALTTARRPPAPMLTEEVRS